MIIVTNKNNLRHTTSCSADLLMVSDFDSVANGWSIQHNVKETKKRLDLYIAVKVLENWKKGKHSINMHK